MKDKLHIRFTELAGILTGELNDEGFWTGELSASALGAAVAVATLHFHDPEENKVEIRKGLDWLVRCINVDGSYGDTPQSPGNISTSLLTYAAFNLYSRIYPEVEEAQCKVAGYLQTQSIDVGSGRVSEAILSHYKKDYTFSVPILTMCALCGIPGDEGFRNIPQLPFELALMPRKIFRLFNLSVVSYAIPALIAVGIVIFKRKQPGKWKFLSGFIRFIRRRGEKKALQILENTMPLSGGFLEAIPLTAFVSLSLLNAKHGDSLVVKKGIDFLKETQRDDGGWPIDVNLSIWVTTLGIKALGEHKDEVLSSAQQDTLAGHLKSVQNRQIHPFNGTAPGGWGWTSYTGSVPDGDDTPGAILALLSLQDPAKGQVEILNAAGWLLKLQNKDGGFPTFSRGWGKLPFDKSCADLTGHCFLAMVTVLHHYHEKMPAVLGRRVLKSLRKAARYLKMHQSEEGSWLPLWFGNQHTPEHENPVYGTARVLSYLNDALEILPENSGLMHEVKQMTGPGFTFLVHVQNGDGSWGGDKGIPGSQEETALAISALAKTTHMDACTAGLDWLDRSFSETGLKAAPIGLYFASLWYDEKMYPLTAYMEALLRMEQMTS